MRDAMGEIGAVDQDDGVRARLQAQNHAASRTRAKNFGNLRNDLAQPHDRGVVEGKQVFRPCAAIAGPPTPVIFTLSPATRSRAAINSAPN